MKAFVMAALLLFASVTAQAEILSPAQADLRDRILAAQQSGDPARARALFHSDGSQHQAQKIVNTTANGIVSGGPDTRKTKVIFEPLPRSFSLVRRIGNEDYVPTLAPLGQVTIVTNQGGAEVSRTVVYGEKNGKLYFTNHTLKDCRLRVDC